MYDFEVPVQYDIHAFNEINKMDIFLEVAFHQACHVKKGEVFQFNQINFLNMVIKERFQNHHCFNWNETSHDHFSQISQNLSL